MTACEALGVTKTDEVGQIAKIVVTNEGSAGFLSMVTPMAVADLQPLISSKDIMEQSQIVTDYLREGRDHFWKGVREERAMSVDQLEKWKSDPALFKMPDGNAPKPLGPSKHDVDCDKQVEEAEANLKPKERTPSYFK